MRSGSGHPSTVTQTPLSNVEPATFDLECAPGRTHHRYSIAQAAAHSGLSVDALRYYERIQLVDPPERDPNGRQVYSDTDLAWLAFLTRLRLAGMPIRRMREYAGLRQHGVASAPRRKQLLLEQRGSVAQRITELQSCMDVLDYKIVNYERLERSGCDRLADASTAELEGVSA